MLKKKEKKNQIILIIYKILQGKTNYRQIPIKAPTYSAPIMINN